ncbi:MAG: phosphatidylserine/phosphatidylglycerophosphate/cardiolipin synthase family protein [Methylotenera sp.]|nr:phosphatidylserine/phosphatidylglycerophosphate/cardiolipin synthase family protein [Oligoflexia bacterium]
MKLFDLKFLKTTLKVIVPLLFMTAASSQAADTVKILRERMPAYWARIDAVRNARTRISTSYYFIRTDRVGSTYLAELAAAAHRGVKVEVLIDGMSPLDSGTLRYLDDAGVELKFFHPAPFQKLGVPLIEAFKRPVRNLRYRMHDKLLLVDDQKGIFGGRNMADDYFEEDGIFNDIDVMITAADENSVLSDVRDYFDEVFSQPSVKKARNLKADDDEMEQTVQWFDEKLKNSDKDYSSEPIRAILSTLTQDTDLIDRDNIRFLHDPATGKKKHGAGIAHDLWSMIAAANSSVKIIAPYLIFTPETEKVVAQLRSDKNIPVEFMTNSVTSMDDEAGLIAALSRGEIARVAKYGVTAREQLGEQTLHMKMAIIDGSRTYVGSYNFDPRSYYFNSEIGIVMDSPAIANKFEAVYQSIDSIPVDSAASPGFSFSRFKSSLIKRDL